MQFTIGLCLLCFTAIVGSYQFFENQEIIASKQRGISTAERKLRSALQTFERLQQIKQKAMVQGQDQKFTIERAMGIGTPGLQFHFLGQPKYNGQDQSFYRYLYRIKGPGQFATMQRVLKYLSTNPGYTVHKICFGCNRPPRDAEEGVQDIQIEGYLYVYNPEALS